MTEPTTEDLVERLKYAGIWTTPEASSLMLVAAQRLSDLEGKLGEATAVVLALFDQWPDNSAPSGPLCVRASNVINASEALKLTASGGGDNSLSQGASVAHPSVRPETQHSSGKK